MNGDPHHRNNFDLLRLLAAAQVVAVHLISMMPGLGSEAALKALSLFPGVPIFFFTSGYLIQASWHAAPDPARYAANRLLRIFPALWLAVLFNLALILLFYAEPMAENAGTATAWLLMQMSFLQSWNPAFLRGYGVGVANPALWTIPVELAFYIVLPLLSVLGARLRRPRAVLLAAALLSFALFVAVFWRLDPGNTLELAVRKVLAQSPLSFVTWLWMFLLGAGAFSMRTWLLPLVGGRFVVFGGVAVGVGVLSLGLDLPPWLHLPGNEIGLLNALANGAACLSFAYSWTGLSARLLQGHDLSYGIYLFHMPIANALIANGVVGGVGAGLAVAGTIACAGLSWMFLERRMLALKPGLSAGLRRLLKSPEGVAA